MKGLKGWIAPSVLGLVACGGLHLADFAMKGKPPTWYAIYPFLFTPVCLTSRVFLGVNKQRVVSQYIKQLRQDKSLDSEELLLLETLLASEKK